MRSASRAVAVLFLSVTAVSCSSSGGGSAAPVNTPEVCSSLDGLQASVTDLRNVQVRADGLTALQENIAAVGADVRQVVSAGKDQYATNVDQLQTEYAAVQAATTAAKATPSAATLGTLSSSIGALADGVKVFSEDVAGTC